MNKVLVSVFMIGVLAIGSICVSGAKVQAGLITSEFDVNNGWEIISDGDGTVGPGVGGQPFDAEYLLYKRTGNLLSIGLQSGFDLIDGHQKVDNRDYYAGDLGLSFDGNTSSYDYAFDFGQLSKDYYNNSLGTHAMGIYTVTDWNVGVFSRHHDADPFAMSSGEIVSGAMVSNSSGSEVVAGEKSYYRIVNLDLTKIANLDLTKDFIFSAHWTMSCGNDFINGAVPVAPVPEPASMLFFSLGFAGLAGLVSRKKKQI